MNESLFLGMRLLRARRRRKQEGEAEVDQVVIVQDLVHVS